MKFCMKCVMPDTRPDLVFDDEGVCDACRSYEKKHGKALENIDWDARRREFEALIAKCGSSDPLKYDCVVPVSGGKDSHTTMYYAKVVYNLKVLAVCFEPTLPTEIGRRNLENISKLGVDLIHLKPNPDVYRKLVLEGFKRVGDPEWINHQGIWTSPVHIAIKFGIPLILWGESPQMEYGGSRTVAEINKKVMNEDWINDYGCLNGLRPHDVVGPDTGIEFSDLKFYLYPNKKEVEAAGILGVFMGYFFKWDIPTNLQIIEKIGWRRRKGRVETSYSDYEKLDCESMNLHDYLKFCKYGFGRASDDASRDIRNGIIQRDEGVRLVERYDGKYPKGIIERFCESFKMTRTEFDAICDAFTNKAIFEIRDGKILRDLDGSLIMKNKYVELRRSPKCIKSKEIAIHHGIDSCHDTFREETSV